MTCNNLFKAMKKYENWREEMRTSLVYDVLVDNNNGKGNVLSENIHKIFNFAINTGR